MYWLPTESYLQHYGILGMKWGVRRYQDQNGSLTEAGKRRYYKLSQKANRQREWVNYYETKLSENQVKMHKANNALIFKPSKRKLQRLANENANLQSLRAKYDLKARKADKRLKKFNDYTNMYKDYVTARTEVQNENWERARSLGADFARTWMDASPRTTGNSRKVNKLIKRWEKEVLKEKRK